MNAKIGLLLLIGTVGAPLFVQTPIAQEIDNQTLEGSVLLDEIPGLVIDRTITRIGHDFYTDFTNYRQLNNPRSQYNLTILERPSARWGSLIWIEYRSTTVFKTFLNPGRSNYRKIAEQTAKQIEDGLNRVRLQQLFSDNIDLEKDEI